MHSDQCCRFQWELRSQKEPVSKMGLVTIGDIVKLLMRVFSYFGFHLTTPQMPCVGQFINNHFLKHLEFNLYKQKDNVEELKSLLPKWKQLRYIKLDGGQFYGESVCRLLGEAYKPRKLKILEIRNLSVCEVFLSNIPLNYPNLQMLKYYPCCARQNSELHAVQKTGSGSAPGFKDLPAEVQTLIFSCFSPQELCKTVAPVCRTWKFLTESISLWKVLTFNYKPNMKREASEFRKLLKKPMQLKKLMVTGIFKYPLLKLSHVVDKSFTSDSLEILIIQFLTVSESFMNNLKVKFPLLQDLRLKTCQYSGDKQNICGEICKLKMLKSLTIDLDINDDILIYLAQNLPFLEKISIYDACRVSNEGIKEFVALKKHTLKYFKWNEPDLDADVILALSNCSNLQHLRIGFTTGTSDVTFGSLKGLNLVSLKLNYIGGDTYENDLVSEQALVRFFSCTSRCHLQKLAFGWLSNMNNTVLKEIAASCVNLTDLSFWCCNRVTNKGLQVCLENLPKLEFLRISSCRKVTKEIFSKIPTCKSFTMQHNYEE